MIEVDRETLEAFASLFKGRTDSHGRIEVCIYEPVTLKHYEQHLKGEVNLGIYFVLDDSTCHFAAIDLDEKDFKKAKAIRDELAKNSIPAYITESKSKGYHVYCFALERFKAVEIRQVLNHILKKLNIKAETFPKQDYHQPDDADGKKHPGSYINLPCFGHTRPFLTGDLKEVPVKVALERIKFVPQESIDRIFHTLPRENPLEPKKVERKRKEHPPCLKVISQGVNEQQREAAALALARHYLVQFYKPEEIFWLLQEWDTKNKPPSYNEPFLENTVRSAEKYRGFFCSLIKDKPTVSTFCVGDEECDWPKPKKLKGEPLAQEEEPDKLNETAVKKLLGTCRFIQHCWKDAKTLPEPHWWSMVHILAVFGDLGREKIHELSKTYPQYTEKETNQKIDEALKAGEKEIGPHTCKFIEQELGFGCPKDCPAKKLDVKSPAGMAKRLASREIHGIYLSKDKAGNWHLNLSKLVDALLSEYFFKTMRDNEECFIYEGGIYTPLGEATIKEECEKRVPKKFMHNSDINEIIGHIKRSTYVKRMKFNREKWVLNLENGLYNIQTSKLSPHTPEFLSTIRIPMIYNPSADCPRVRRFFTEVLRQDDILIIEELFGYCLVPDYTIQKAFLFLGDGANGKSTLLEVLKNFIGADNCTNMSIQAIEYQRFAKATLFGKLANIYADIPSTKMEHVGVFKTLTGGDTVDGEKKFKDPFSFNNTARLIFSTNKPPKVEEDTLAFWRRWIFINFPHKFEGKQADKRLLQELIKKEELSGLLNIALDGLKRLLNKQEYSHELSPDKIAEWHQRASDSIYAFIEDICEATSDTWISKDGLYDVFVEYCDKQNIPRIGIESFGRALKNARNIHVTFKRKGPRGAQKTGWLGIQLREGEEEKKIDMEV